MGEHQAKDERAMPLDGFITEVMHLLQIQPDASEICVQKVYPLRHAAEGGQEKYVKFFKGFNDAMTSSGGEH